MRFWNLDSLALLIVAPIMLFFAVGFTITLFPAFRYISIALLVVFFMLIAYRWLYDLPRFAVPRIRKEAEAVLASTTSYDCIYVWLPLMIDGVGVPMHSPQVYLPRPISSKWYVHLNHICCDSISYYIVTSKGDRHYFEWRR